MTPQALSATSPAADAAAAVACFSVVADADPGVLSRLLQVFAKRGLVPSRLYGSRGGPGGEDLHVDLQFAGLDARLVAVVAETLRQVVSVQCVLTSEKRAL
jgi:acetolactate synthase regulatory subunit